MPTAPQHPDAPLILQLIRLSKVYSTGQSELAVFRDLCLEIREGEQVAVMGESGAGKSTLLHLIAGLDRPTSGSVMFRGRDLGALSEGEVAAFRNRDIGYVWQQHRLLPDFTCVENVMMPMLVAGGLPGLKPGVPVGGSPRRDPKTAREAAMACLEEVGLAARSEHRPGELSGGEQQRVAIARALVNCPSLLLADEPTGNLDEKTAEKVFELLSDLRSRRGLTSVLVTHNRRFAESCGRLLALENGSLR